MHLFHGNDIPVLPYVPLALTPEEILALDVSRIAGGPARLDTVEKDVDLGALLVRGYIAPQVYFDVWLPVETWSQRLLVNAPGGYGGVRSYLPFPSNPIDRSEDGYRELVRVSFDAGHRTETGALVGDGVWAVGDPQAIIDLAYGACHRIALFAKAFIGLVYGRAPRYSYLLGCSSGGRQAMGSAQRYPDDFDGIAADAPTIDMVSTNSMWHGWNARVNTDEHGRPVLTVDKLPGLHRAVLEQAGKDGALIAGQVSDPRKVAFDPATLAGDATPEEARLSPAQVDTVRKLYQGPISPNGRPLFPRGHALGSEYGWIGVTVPAAPDAVMSDSTVADLLCSSDFTDFMSSFAGPTGLRNRNFDFSEDQFAQLHRLSPIFDPTDPDLHGFRQAEGKLLVWQGWADSGSSAYSVVNYHSSVVEFMGEDDAAEVMALYMVPGLHHGGYGPDSTYGDYVTALMRWVERGERPQAIPVTYNDDGGGQAEIAALRDALANWGALFAAPQAGEVRPFDRSVDLPTTFDWEGLRHYQPGHTRWGWVPPAQLLMSNPDNS